LLFHDFPYMPILRSKVILQSPISQTFFKTKIKKKIY